jgi:peptidoglycan/xylan/chitin deacetylase (PgdA/CDA1 family)
VRAQLARLVVLAVAGLGLASAGPIPALSIAATASPTPAAPVTRVAVLPRSPGDRSAVESMLGLRLTPAVRHPRSLAVAGSQERMRMLANRRPAPDVRFATPWQYAPVDAEISTQFSEAMADASLTIDPAVPGTVSWPDQSTMVFRPAAPLAYRTLYRVAVVGLVAAGANLAASGSFTFQTVWAPPAVAMPFTLTFDDCGTADAIRAIMDLLAQRGLHAIFFPTGMCRDQFPWLVPTLLAAGHSVCNHTYSHADLSRASDAVIVSEIQRGVTVGCNLFRPPYGAMDRAGRVARIASSLGYRIQLWDVDTRDWAGTPAPAMDAMIRARGGVVLFHMHGIHTLEALSTL